MREAMSGLTTRGRCFLSAGIASALSAVLLGQMDILRVAVLLIALPLVSAWIVVRSRVRLACRRYLAPGRVAAGEEARVHLRLENVSRIPTGRLLIEDRLPYVLGVRPRFVMERVPPRARRTLSYPVRCESRGRYSVGPLAIRLGDPFGMCELTRSFNQTDTLLVTPAVVRLPAVPLGGEWAGTGDSRSRSVAVSGEDDVATREYRHGDERRRVHWRSTARRGQLMVRREELPWESHCTILLDTREDAHRGDGPASSFEFAVSAAASVALHTSHAGYTVALHQGDGELLASAEEGTPADAVLDPLAVVRLTSGGPLRPPPQLTAPDGLLIAVMGRCTAEDAQSLLHSHQRGSSGVVILLDLNTWRGRGEVDVEAPTALFRANGWRVIRAGAHDDLALLWRGASRNANLGVGVGA